jgi:hypothetical protein
MGKYELIASTALIFNMTSFFTLLYKVHQTKNTSTLPWIWLYLNLSAQILLITYAILNGAWGIYIPSSFLLLGLLYITYIKWVWRVEEIDIEKNKK